MYIAGKSGPKLYSCIICTSASHVSRPTPKYRSMNTSWPMWMANTSHSLVPGRVYLMRWPACAIHTAARLRGRQVSVHALVSPYVTSFTVCHWANKTQPLCQMTDVIKPQLHTYRGAEWGKRKTKTKIQVTSLVFGSGFPVSSDLSPLHVGGGDGGKKTKKREER